MNSVSSESASTPIEPSCTGTLLPVNVRMPKDVPSRETMVFTGVLKAPVAGPRRVRRLNIDSDGQGDLGDLTPPWSDDYASLLELAEACDVPVRWSCRTGVCHNCETTLIAGTVDYDPDPVEPPADGSTLICCSRPLDDVVLDL